MSWPQHAVAPRPDLKGVRIGGSSLAVERLPGLARALDRFVAEAPIRLAGLFGETPPAGAVEAPQSAMIFKALHDCAGLTAAIYENADPPGRLIVALDERIDDLVLASVFGEDASPNRQAAGEAASPAPRTAIETALIEAFARALGQALEAGFAQFAPLRPTFERLVVLADLHALGRRDGAAAAARVTLPMRSGSCAGLLLIPQALLAPFRKAFERVDADEPAAPDKHWARLMETEVQHTRLRVNAILDELPMTLADLAGLRVGSLLRLKKPALDSVRLDCAGRGVFLCRLGQGDGRYRLEVTGSAPPEADVRAA